MSEFHPEISKLVAAGKLPVSAASKVSTLTEGVFVLHKSWGVGRIGAWELDDERLLIDFEDRKAHPMKLEFAATTLTVIPETHIMARRHADAASLTKIAQEDAPAMVRLVLESHGGKMTLDDFEKVIKPRIISEAKFKNWWENTKKALKSRPEFIVPSKRNLPLELRGGDLSASDALLDDFRKARDVKGKAKALEAIVRESALFTQEQVEPVLREADEAAARNLRLSSADSFELILHRDDLMEKFPALREKSSMSLGEALLQEQARVADFISGLSITRQYRCFDALTDSVGAEGVPGLLKLFTRLNARSIGELAKVLWAKDYKDELRKYIATGVAHRSLTSDGLVWLCRERTGIAKDMFVPEVSGALFSAIERDHHDESRKSNRVYDMLIDDKNLISDIITGVDLPRVRNFARQLWMTTAIDEMGRRSLLARFIRVYPVLEQLIHEGDQPAEKPENLKLFVSWQSLVAKKKALHHLVRVEIPKNTQDITIAASYGDLRENFEYKSARENAKVLNRRREDIERDLRRSEPTDFSDRTTDAVCMGTRVDIEDVATGQKESYTILGAWDADPDNHILSYLAGAAVALMGKKVGDTAELSQEESRQTRTVKITAIHLAELPPIPADAKEVAEEEIPEPEEIPEVEVEADA